MAKNVSLVITSIAAPTPALHDLARGCRENDVPFYLVGDETGPPPFHLDGCDVYDLGRQKEQGFQFAFACPTRHYARKNIGYLIAARAGAQTIVETDDDNFPLSSFWRERNRELTVPTVEGAGWLNVYRYFTDVKVWPRGLPLDAALMDVPDRGTFRPAPADCPIQQGLADENPDVDAIYRLVGSLPVHFQAAPAIAVGVGSWCPFNSQNTTWWADAFPLLYLPSFCSFRMTDILRSLIAQRIAWQNNWSILFHAPTVRQVRNEHDLMRDFADEIPGYLHNRKIAEILEGLSLRRGTEHMTGNLLQCYEALVTASLLDARELPLLQSWLGDLAACGNSGVKS